MLLLSSLHKSVVGKVEDVEDESKLRLDLKYTSNNVKEALFHM